LTLDQCRRRIKEWLLVGNEIAKPDRARHKRVQLRAANLAPQHSEAELDMLAIDIALKRRVVVGS